MTPNTNDGHRLAQAKLIEKGWKGGMYSGQEDWYKRFPNTPSCKQDQDKRGACIQCKVHRMPRGIEYEIILAACKPDDIWCSLKIYGIGSELLSVIDAQCEHLIQAWIAMHRASL